MRTVWTLAIFGILFAGAPAFADDAFDAFHSAWMIEVGQRLKNAVTSERASGRHRYKITQAALSQHMEIGQPNGSKIINGTHLLSLRAGLLAAEYLNVDPDKLRPSFCADD